MARYVPLGDIYGNQRLGAFDGPLGDLASARQTLASAQRENNAAGNALNQIASATARCSALPGGPTMPLIACPTTASSQQSKLSAAQRRVATAQASLKRAQDAVSSEESAANIRGAASIINPLATAGAQIASAFIQADALKNQRPAAISSGGGTTTVVEEKKSSLPLIVGGLAVLGVVVGAVVMMGGKKPAAAKAKRMLRKLKRRFK